MDKSQKIREFAGGGKRDTADNKYEYYGFQHPLLEHSYCAYMHKHRKMPDGSLRDSNNWWKGWDKTISLQSALRHMADLQAIHAGYKVYKLRDDSGEQTIMSLADINREDYNLVTVSDCCNAIIFNMKAYLLQYLKEIGLAIIDDVKEFKLAYPNNPSTQNGHTRHNQHPKSNNKNIK